MNIKGEANAVLIGPDFSRAFLAFLPFVIVSMCGREVWPSGSNITGSVWTNMSWAPMVSFHSRNKAGHTRQDRAGG